MQPSLQKLLQKRLYDVLSHTYGVIFIVAGLLFLMGSVFMFSETVLEWSRDKYAAVFNSFSENIAGKSFQNRLCLPVPIDVVYTWVNGSDPDLLKDLKRYKLELEKEINVSRSGTEKEKEKDEGTCLFSQCVQVMSIVLEPDLQRDITVERLRNLSPLFKEAVEIFPVSLSDSHTSNFTVVTFSNREQVERAINQSFVWINKQNHTIHKAFITSDWTVQHSILSHDTIIMSGFPHTYSAEQLKAALPEKHRKGVNKIDLHSDQGLAVMYVPKRTDFEALIDLNNLTIEGKEPTLNAANLVWDLSESLDKHVASPSRFEDNEELRYSIRSLERFAPWIRHIYIVTNGQIPSWLNMDHPGVTIVTHEEIFLNKSHLPTFGSPAIESHLHRIAGLSDKFIYLNDDVMFGKEVWPDDFYTHARGQKVYLSWPVPNCQEGCPSNWIRDGYCDKACNNSQCDWDAGDCLGSPAAGNQGGGQGGFYFNNNHDNKKMYCASGCANNWIADKYCDQSCNVITCGFDAADCGTDNFHQLYRIDFNSSITEYTVPRGEGLLYLNLSSLLVEDAVITQASYNKSEVIRTAAVSLKFKVMTIVLQENHNQTKLSFHIQGNHGVESSTFQYNFTMLVDTRPGSKRNNTVTKAMVEEQKLEEVSKNNGSEKVNVTSTREPPFLFEEIPPDDRSPQRRIPNVEILEAVKSVNLSALNMSDDLKAQWEDLQNQLTDGDITEKGFQQMKMKIWKQVDKLHVGEEKRKSEIPVMNRDHGKMKTGQRSLLMSLIEESSDNELSPFNRRSNFIFDKGSNSSVNKSGRIDLQHVLKPGGFKWERSGLFIDLLKERDKLDKQKQYILDKSGTGRSLNQFADSLRHVNKIYNKEFGYSARKVPSHMPHMIDKHVMAELQERFPQEWDLTSSHKVRSSTDMQFAFSYFYYLMGVTRNISASEVFDMMDTDKSRMLSDREIRTLATRLYNLPLDLQTLTGLETIMINCSKKQSDDLRETIPDSARETYYVTNMPQVTRNLFIHCEEIVDLLSKNFQPQPLYQYDIIGDDSEVAFKMIKTNVSSIVGQLDDIRKHPKKFICLNDNIDHKSNEAKTVKAILVDFYESMFPIPSQFELPRDYRNRFSRIEELRKWKKYRDWLKFWTNIALVLLVVFAVMSFFGDKIDSFQRSLTRRRAGQSAKHSKAEENHAKEKSSIIQTV